MPFTAVDAFCGAGGLTLGLLDAGFDLRLSFDLDARCIETMRSNPRTASHRAEIVDVRDMLGGVLLSELGMVEGELDLLAGGPPCQGFSIQRTIGSDDDDRNLLVHDYGDLILEVMPRFFLMENVPGLGGRRGAGFLATFVRRMTDSGYLVHQRVLDAQEFGVPQRRKRLVLVGERSSVGSGTFAWPNPDENRPPTVREVIAHLPPPPAPGVEHPDFPNHLADKPSAVNRARLRALESGQARTDLPAELLADCHKVSAEVTGHRNVYGRMSWDEVAPTITARFDSFTRGKFGHPDQIRTISLREGALLQTFPEHYGFVGSKVEVARQIGNAVPPLLGAALGRAISAALSTDCSR